MKGDFHAMIGCSLYHEPVRYCRFWNSASGEAEPGDDMTRHICAIGPVMADKFTDPSGSAFLSCRPDHGLFGY
jgi:hypothetical protein